MPILIRNPETAQRLRKLAAQLQMSLPDALGWAMDQEIARVRGEPVEDMESASRRGRFRKQSNRALRPFARRCRGSIRPKISR